MATELEAYEEWLRAKRLTADHKVRFFVGWVERFMRLRTTRAKEAWQDTLRVSELVQLRVKDIDFESGMIMVRISAGCRSCWVTRAWRPPCCTPMCCRRWRRRCAARWTNCPADLQLCRAAEIFHLLKRKAIAATVGRQSGPGVGQETAGIADGEDLRRQLGNENSWPAPLHQGPPGGRGPFPRMSFPSLVSQCRYRSRPPFL